MTYVLKFLVSAACFGLPCMLVALREETPQVTLYNRGNDDLQKRYRPGEYDTVDEFERFFRGLSESPHAAIPLLETVLVAPQNKREPWYARDLRRIRFTARNVPDMYAVTEPLLCVLAAKVAREIDKQFVMTSVESDNDAVRMMHYLVIMAQKMVNQGWWDDDQHKNFIDSVLKPVLGPLQDILRERGDNRGVNLYEELIAEVVPWRTGKRSYIFASEPSDSGDTDGLTVSHELPLRRSPSYSSLADMAMHGDRNESQDLQLDLQMELIAEFKREVVSVSELNNFLSQKVRDIRRSDDTAMTREGRFIAALTNVVIGDMREVLKHGVQESHVRMGDDVVTQLKSSISLLDAVCCTSKAPEVLSIATELKKFLAEIEEVSVRKALQEHLAQLSDIHV